MLLKTGNGHEPAQQYMKYFNGHPSNIVNSKGQIVTKNTYYMLPLGVAYIIRKLKKEHEISVCNVEDVE